MKKSTLIEIVLLLLALLIALGFETLPGYFVSEETAVRALETNGFTDIAIVSRHPILRWGCGNGDAVRFDATATNPREERVKIYVCVGWPFKGATIRTP